MLHTNDMATARRILQGDQDAFEQFYEAYYDRLFRFCLRRLNGGEGRPDGRDLAYDMVQQTLERALRYLYSYQGEASLYTWLCQICRNEIASWFKKTGNDPFLHVSLDDNPAIKAILESEDYHGTIDEQTQLELSQMVQIAIDALPDRYASVLEYRYLQGMSVEQISTRIGASYLATESLLARARRTFKSLLADLAAEHLLTPDVGEK
jgi:RNA polymerase sigma-70 factor, ECF subfamily